MRTAIAVLEPPLVAAPPRPLLHIRLFGSVEVTVEGEPVPRTRAVDRLLAFLGVRLGQAVDRRLLAGSLWPESPERVGLANLRRLLLDLRHALGPCAYRVSSPRSGTLRLEAEGVWTDLAAFQDAIARGDAASLEAAVALRRLPLLEGFGDDWALEARAGVEKQYLEALVRLAALHEEGNDLAAAGRCLRLVVTADPLQEHAQRRLMETLAANGEVAAATRVYRDLRLLLHRELNSEPAPETVEAFERVRSRARSRGRPSGGSSRPAHLPVGRLPRPVSGLVGREAEAREVIDYLRSASLVTLTGAGGIGKTRLAIEAADRGRAGYPGGAWFVDLSPLAENGLVPRAFLAALRCPDEPGRAPVETIVQAVGDRSLLLVVDNCEHLLAGVGGLVRTLLEGCPRLRVLATSRERLGIPGEVVWRVPPLTAPAADAGSGGGMDAAALLGYDAVRLFVDRASEVRPELPLGPELFRAAAEICRRLDGLPLAIELAASRVAALPAPEVARRLEGALDARLRLLSAGGKAAPARQNTLRATLDWSYALLTEAERALLARLAVFAGGWTLEAAEAVCAGGGITRRDVLDLLTGLAEKSLVSADPTGRFRMLETVREYAAEKLREAEPTSGGDGADSVQHRHLEYFTKLAEEADRQLRRPEQRQWLARLEEAQGNFRAALDWSQRFYPEGALRLALALAGYWSMAGSLEEGSRRLAEIIRLTEERADGPVASALLRAGSLALCQGDYPRATEWYERSLDLYRRLGNATGIVYVTDARGWLAFHQGDLAAGAHAFATAVASARELANTELLASALYGLGTAVYHQGCFEQTREVVEEALALFIELDDRCGEADAIGMLALLARRERRYDEAEALYGRAIDLHRGLGDRKGEAVSLGGLAETAREQGDLEMARRLYQADLEISREMHARFQVGVTLNSLAEIAFDQGDLQASATYHDEALSLFRTMGAELSIIHTLGSMGHNARSLGEFDRARELYAESLRIRLRGGDEFTIILSLEDFAELARLQNDYARSAVLMAAAFAARQRSGKPFLPVDWKNHERVTQGDRLGLGDARFEAAWETGLRLTLEAAAALALSDDWEPASQDSPDGSG
jgi:predicted ATPase/DNA-binding SARP family transcriptional activator